MRRSATTFENIGRIAAPGPDDLDRSYVRTGTPVVIAGLFAGAPATRLAIPVVARAELGHLPLPTTVRPGAGTGDGAGGGHGDGHGDGGGDGGGPPRTLAFAELYDELAGGAVPRRVCVDHETPAPLVAALPAPYLGLGMPQDPWLSRMFLVGPGDVTPLHYDRDLRNVIVVQVFGRQSFLLADPARAPGPRARDRLGLSALRPGEALLIPAAFWQQVEAHDVSLSVSFRLRRNRFLERLAAWAPDPGVALLPLATCFRDDRAVPPWARDALASLTAAL